MPKIETVFLSARREVKEKGTFCYVDFDMSSRGRGQHIRCGYFEAHGILHLLQF